MSSRPQTPTTNSRPISAMAAHQPGDATYGASGATDFAENNPHGALIDSSPLSQSAAYQQNEMDTMVDGGGLTRPESQMSQSQTLLPSRGGTLKKRGSLKKSGSIKRSLSRRSSYAGSVRSLSLGEKEKYAGNEEMKSAFYTPVPTSGNPTEMLANRFQGKRGMNVMVG